MKFSCNSNQLFKAVQITEKAVSQRSSLPVLENIFFELKEGFSYNSGNNPNFLSINEIRNLIQLNLYN